ncbi:MAG: Gfo/Idh/MocA family protein [Armatimonadota bacterium]|jgi:predicted dehydrogenase
MAIRWGVIGCGGIADRRTIPEGIVPAASAELVAVQDVAEGRMREVAEKYGVTGYLTVEELLADDAVDAVYIATPTHVHHEQTVVAAKAGKHVLCEKPLALTQEECVASIEACAEAGVKFGTNFMMRFHACHTMMREMVAAGELGTPVLGRGELTCWYPPIEGAFRQSQELGGGGSLIDMGNHCIDLLEFILGSKVARVACFTEHLVQDYETEDTAVVTLHFENGAVGIVDALFNVPDAAARNMLELYGSGGSMVTQGTIGQGSTGSITAVIEGDAGDYDAQQARGGAAEQIIEPDVVNMYEAAIEGFCAAIANDTEPPVPGEDGLWSHRVIDACYESARTGRVVTLQ